VSRVRLAAGGAPALAGVDRATIATPTIRRIVTADEAVARGAT